MNFRAKLLTLFTLTVVLSVGLVAWAVSYLTRDAFERLNNQRTDALVAQFQREFQRRSNEVTRRVEGIANADETLRMAVSLGGGAQDLSSHFDDASASPHRINSIFSNSLPPTARSFRRHSGPRVSAIKKSG